MLTEEALADNLEFHNAVTKVSYTFTNKAGLSHDFSLQDICNSAAPYLLPCLRFSVLDCFKEGKADFSKTAG